ncbi:MAG: Na(+)-translocating NADH-quinone reductase subunit A [Pseudomonadota bacterium]|nr:Na(+)-translocating NADH-quinone reductase subunit A [Pseudomonadota bacterium]
MQQYTCRKGLNVPVLGQPGSGIGDAPSVTTVAILGADYIGLKPRLAVKEGDIVGAGAPIFAHKDTPTVHVTSPVNGRIKAVTRGARRVLISVEIEIDDSAAEPVDFSKVGDINTEEGLVERLSASGLWTSFRTRPYSKVPEPETRPAAIFVTATDSEPLCGDAEEIINADSEAFATGLAAVARLTEGKTYLCQHADAKIPGADIDGVEAAGFSGPHPSGLAGTHIHFLEPPTASTFVWTIGYHDVISIGKLLATGNVDGSRVVALSGPLMKEPRMVRTVAGASMEELTKDGLNSDVPVRLISGSILSGRMGAGETAYLGRYARQLTAIEEDKKQIPMGWIRPMPSKYAVQPVLGSAFSKKIYALTSNLNGGRRAMVPTGTFEQLMPQDYLPTQLLRAMLVMDTDQAQLLGALELDEEDLGLVGFACPAKYEYGIALRDCLTKIEKEG